MKNCILLKNLFVSWAYIVCSFPIKRDRISKEKGVLFTRVTRPLRLCITNQNCARFRTMITSPQYRGRSVERLLDSAHHSLTSAPNSPSRIQERKPTVTFQPVEIDRLTDTLPLFELSAPTSVHTLVQL